MNPAPVLAALVLMLLPLFGGVAATPHVAAMPNSSSNVSAHPEPGSLPNFRPLNYTYTYTVSCFCAAPGTYTVTVVNGRVANIRARNAYPGQVIPEFRQVSLQDIVNAANETHGDLTVRWPADSTYPHRIVIDAHPGALDSSVAFTVDAVKVPSTDFTNG